MFNLTPLVRRHFLWQARRFDSWAAPGMCEQVQLEQLRSLLREAAATEHGRRYGYEALAHSSRDLAAEYAERVPLTDYEAIRETTMRMVRGESDLLWPGRTRNFAQSSGTSGGKSKFIPITPASLRENHYAGASDAVAAYLRLNSESRLFSGKALILGGSFANELADLPRGTRVGDLSATLIDRVPPLGAVMRTPDKRIALMPDWEQKLPLLADAALHSPVTSLSGVPSWFLILLREVMRRGGVSSLHEIWPGLEVFFHGGISFEPYRAEYVSFTDPKRMHFLETYNASEGFFGVQTDPADRSMLLLLDRGVYYEFAPMLPDGEWGEPVPLAAVQTGRTYSMYISACNGLWRYAIGDTVRFTSLCPPKFVIAGRTKSFINAFGEELMEHNAEQAMAETCRKTGARVANYTAGPVYASCGKRGRHRWLIEFSEAPADIADFAATLDRELQRVNSDYQAKRAGGIFLDAPQVRVMPTGYFDRWLTTHGNGKLGGQRKIPRLCPTAERLASLEEG